MKSVKHFNRFVRQEVNRISTTIKQMEFRILRLRGFLRRKLREEIQELRRMKDAILHRLSELTVKAQAHIPTMQSIRDDIDLLHERCRQLKAQHL